MTETQQRLFDEHMMIIQSMVGAPEQTTGYEIIRSHLEFWIKNQAPDEGIIPCLHYKKVQFWRYYPHKKEMLDENKKPVVKRTTVCI